MTKRTVTFTVEANGGVTPAVPQFGGVKGEHNATDVRVILNQDIYQDGDVVRLSFTTGDGTVLSSDLIDCTVSETDATVEYALPQMLTVAAGQLCMRAVISRMDENGNEVECWRSHEMVLYFDEASVENGTPFWTGVSEMLKRTVDAKDAAVEAAETAFAIQNNGSHAATAAIGARDKAQSFAKVASAEATNAAQAAERAEGFAQSAWEAANTPGRQGAQGLSAYEVAVKNGFVHDELSWLATLKGEKGDPGEGGGETYGTAPMRKPQTVIVNNVQDSTTYRTSGTVTEDTADHVLWDKSVRVSGNGAYIRFHKNYLPFSMDMKHNLLVLKIKINSMAAGAELYVKVGNAENPSVLVPFNLMRHNADTVYGEWQEYTLSYRGNASTAADISQVDFEDITDIYVIGSNGAVDFNVQFIGYRPNKMSKGIVSFTFDDGWKTAADGIKALAEKGATGTLYVIEDATGADYLTVAEMRELVKLYGTDIEAHGGIEYQNLTDEQLIAHWQSTKRFLTENGLSGGEHLAFPGGMRSPHICELARRYFRSCRTIQGYTPFETFPPYNAYEMRAVTGVSQNSTNNAARIKALIDGAAETNTWLMLVFHKIDDGTGSESCNMATFKDIVDYAVSANVDIMNVAEVFETNGGGNGVNIADILDALPIYNGEVE